MMMMKLCSVLWITWTALDCTVFFNISTSSIKGPSVSISTGLFSPDGSTYKTHYSGKESNRNTDRNMSVKEPLAADGMKQTDVSRNSCRSERNRVTWLTGSSTTKRSDPDHVMHDWIQKLTCGFDLARFSIFIQASSRSFSLAFSLEAKAVFSSGIDPSHDTAAVFVFGLTCSSRLWTVVCSRQTASGSSPWRASVRYRSNREWSYSHKHTYIHVLWTPSTLRENWNPHRNASASLHFNKTLFSMLIWCKQARVLLVPVALGVAVKRREHDG